VRVAVAGVEVEGPHRVNRVLDAQGARWSPPFLAATMFSVWSPPCQRDDSYLAARASHDTIERELPARTGEGRQLPFLKVSLLLHAAPPFEARNDCDEQHLCGLNAIHQASLVPHDPEFLDL
jgi:hypothetical protein